MYVAHFDTSTGQFVSALFALTAKGGSPLLSGWVSALLSAKDCDFAIRFQISEGTGRCWLWIVADDEDTITRLLATLPDFGATLEPVGDRTAFDAVACQFPPEHLRLNHAAYHSHGWPISAGFHLLPMLAQFVQPCLDRGEELVYQLNCQRRSRDPEHERRLRKLEAEIAIDPTLPAPVRSHQQTLLTNALRPGFLVDEFFALPSEKRRDEVLLAAKDYFAETCYHLRFPGVPLESEPSDDSLITGAHSYRLGERLHPLHDAGSFMSSAELQRLLLTAPSFSLVPSHVDATDARVFISYASRDFSTALTVCQTLERQGHTCWIAPRNILPGEAYPEAILRGIKASRVLVLVFSEAANLSPHVHRELDRAINNRTTIIPLRIEARMPEGALEFFLSLCQWVDGFPGEENFAAALDRVTHQVAAALAVQ